MVGFANHAASQRTTQDDLGYHRWGMPDNQLAANNAIGVAQKLGFEVYGLGIRDEHITHLLPDTSKVVNDLPDLVPAMFAMLQAALLKGGAA